MFNPQDIRNGMKNGFTDADKLDDAGY